MTDGIRLTFDDDGVATQEQVEEQQCFGGCKCPHSERREKQMWCALKDCSVLDFCDGSIDERCPEGRWRKLAVPIGYQNIHILNYNPEAKKFKKGKCWWL
jgi:hypothetical protein